MQSFLLALIAALLLGASHADQSSAAANESLLLYTSLVSRYCDSELKYSAARTKCIKRVSKVWLTQFGARYDALPSYLITANNIAVEALEQGPPLWPLLSLVGTALIAIFIQRWVGLVYWSQPTWNHPLIFSQRPWSSLLRFGPVGVLALLIWLADEYTEYGGYFLLGSVVLFLSVLPSKSPTSASPP
jgi:hypothetical protein